MLGIDEGAGGAHSLGGGDDREGQGGFTRGLRAVDFDDPAFRQTAYAEGDIQPQGTSGNGRDRLAIMIAHAHDRAFAELLFDLAQGSGQGTLLVLVHYNPHLIKRARGRNNCISRQY